ncbi:MAG: hypothetical protein ACREAM_15160 [Blastocatellia bacterium]
MNPLILTIIIALATFILAIFGASWLNQQAMNKRIDDLKMYLDARFDAVTAEFRGEFKAVRAEIGTLRAEMAALNQRVDRIERQLEAVFKPSPSRGGD